MGLSWEYMDAIGCLPSLKVLKLRSYAFVGSHWETDRSRWKPQRPSFSSLEYLLIEESDLVQWKPGFESFRRLSYLSMKHCYELEEIHKPYSLSISGIKIIEIELEDCNPLALTCAKKLQPSAGVTLRVIASYSLYEKPTTIKFVRLVLNSKSNDVFVLIYILQDKFEISYSN